MQPGTLTLVFTKQPGAAKFDAPIPSTSAPDPITVLAEDAYGNAAPDGTGVTMIAPGILSGTLSATTVGGLAKYTNLRIATVGIYRLIARLDGASPIVTVTSDPFAIANDLQNCTNVSLCTSTASTGNQSSSARITTSSTTFQNIVLTTTFFDASASNCSGFTLVPGTKLTDVSIQSGNVAAAAADVPGHSHHPQGDPPGGGLHPAIGDSFDACVGAKWLGTLPDARVPWTNENRNRDGAGRRRVLLGARSGLFGLCRPARSIRACA